MVRHTRTAIACIAAVLILAACGSAPRQPGQESAADAPSRLSDGQASDIEIQAREIMRMREWLETTLSKHSKRTVEQVNRDIDRDKILDANEALEYGLIDQVLTSRKNPQPVLGQ